MVSFNENGQNPGSKRRRRAIDTRRVSPFVESMEDRCLLATAIVPPFQPTSTVIGDVKNGPLAPAGQNLITIYQEYQQYAAAGGTGQFHSSLSGLISIKGNKVGVDVSGTGDFAAFQATLKNLGMDVTATASSLKIVEGYLPISQLPTVLKLPQYSGIQPSYKPTFFSVGSASNQGETALLANVAKTTYGVDGTGVKVGVLSDSVNEFDNPAVPGIGLAESYSTGDLDPTNPVTVLKDLTDTTVATDEGRAMLEQIHDIAPGAKLYFYTAGDGDVDFANGIRALAQAGCTIIVDDVHYFAEPFFQDGVIQQAINDVVNSLGVTYFSAAGNQQDAGYSSQFRGVTANVAGIGNGRFMNFNPGGGAAVTGLPVTVGAGGDQLTFQYDNPFTVTNNGVTSDVDVYFLDSKNTVVAGGNSNNIATGQPLEIFGVPAGTYTMVIQVAPGSPDVGRVQITSASGGTVFSQQFGAAGGTYYPSTSGHNAGALTISVGAVPWWNTPAYGVNSGLVNEGFSSFGPAQTIFSPDGTRLSSPVVLQKPDVSGTDGNDTSFFAPGTFLSTLTPFPGTGPASATELDGNTLPNFFGTSSASPNLAAVAALMKQLSPSSTRNDILSAMKASALPLNGGAQGQYNVQGGYGLVQASNALAAVDLLRVVAANPASGATITSLPATIDLTFSRAIDFSTIQASDLVFTNLPAGVTVTVGTPIRTSATTVSFPISVNSPIGTQANGAYAFRLAAGSVASTDGRPLTAYSESFTVNDQIAPRVINTVVTGRQILIKFSEPVRPDAITGYLVKLLRLDSLKGTGAPDVYVNTFPGFQVRYDSANNTAIIDLSQVNQALLPTGSYEIIVSDAVTDLAGNPLDGEFQAFKPPAAPGVFPSGNGVAGGNFFQILSNQVLGAPKVLTLILDPIKGPAPYTTSDTGIIGDQNTLVRNPFFTGSVVANFPGTYAGVTLAVQFSGLHGGTFDLNVGPGGRGFVGNPDLLVTTDSNGNFSFQTPGNLVDGLQTIRIVAVGQTDLPPLPGLSSSFDKSFRIDTTQPILAVDPSSLVQPGTNVSNLSGGIILKAVDPILPATPGSPFSVPTQFSFSALEPSTANDISNYSLINLGADSLPGGTGANADTDFSNFIKSATFTSTNARVLTSDPYTGTVALSFAAGLPAGTYQLVAHTYSAGFVGIYDSAGNVLDGDPTTPGNQDFKFQFNLQPTAAYITSVQAVRTDTVTVGGQDQSTISMYGPRSYFELPVPGTTPRADAPPTQFYIDLSTPLQPGVNYSNKVELIRSANGPTGNPDGDFGTDPTFTTGIGYSIVPGTTVTLTNADPAFPTVLNRLILSLPPGTTLGADHYRLFIPNVVTPSGVDQRIYDIYNNQLDGEFLGNPTAAGGYENLLPNGQYRQGLSGDGVSGGSFETSYIVVPNGNIVYVRPDYVDEPLLSSDDPDGSLAKPYPTLAPEGDPTKSSDLNSSKNFLSGFNAQYDRNGNGQFDRSALVAAQQLSASGTLPVVVVALPGIIQRDPITGQVTQATYVIQAPSGSDPIANDASISIPKNTAMVFNAGSTVKLYNAAIFVQNQGSSIDVRGTANNPVTFTSYLDDSIGGDTNHDGPSTGSGGDWGGIVLRNFNDTNRAIPVAPGPLYPNTPKLGVSGADDALSTLNYAKIRFGGGAVPQTIGYRFDSITLFNSRPAITNSIVSDSAPAAGSSTPSGTGGAQAAISGDMDSFREDPLTRGPLIRRVQTFNNSINGIYVRSELNGSIEPTDAITYTSTAPLGSTLPRQSYTFDDPLPYVIISRLDLGTMLQVDTGQQTIATNDRLYISPGMLVKFQRGAGFNIRSGGVGFGGSVVNAAQLIVGDRTYISQYDLNNNVSPLNPLPKGTANAPFDDGKFHAPTSGDAKVVFTSFFDDNASTSFFDPVTGITTQIVAPIDSDNGGPINLPTAGNVPPLARWGGIAVFSGAIADIDEAEFRFGGGSVNSAGGTIGQRDVLSFEGAGGSMAFGQVVRTPLGTRAYITNNDFFDNASAPISTTPDGMLAADPLTPLTSGNPFFRGNVMVRNDLNGMEILATNGVYAPNQHVDSVWDDTDLVYILRSTVILDGGVLPNLLGTGTGGSPLTAYQAEPRPYVVLTIQAGLPDTLLANGLKIARPGETNLVKMLNQGAPVGDGINGLPASTASSFQGGAGFLVGIDNGIDPPADSLIDLGANSQIRITGIGGNETTGQQRVPVVMTSLRDSVASATRTVRGVTMGDAANPTQFGNTTPAAPGDGGIIGFGSLSLTDYNLFDPRDGNLIDNADIRYMTRIEIQGGGLIDNPGGDYDSVRAGTTPQTQFNASKAMTISNTNISSFSQVGILEHPGFDAIQRGPGITPNGIGAYGRIPGVRGQPNNLFLVNSTISNTPVGMRVNGEPSPTSSPLINEAVLLNNTFYNNLVGVHIEAPFSVPGTNLGGVNFVAMDNIFAGSTTTSIEVGASNLRASQMQYNLFFNSGAPSGAVPNFGPITGDPRFRDAANGDFSLLADSAAIDSARSELNYDPGVATLRAITDQSLIGTVGGIRNSNYRLSGRGTDPLNILSLPGYSVREPGRGASPAPFPTQSFYDQWIPQSILTTPSAANGYQGPASTPGVTFNYAPITGERDSLGYLRIDDTARANIGTGSRPFFDIGAFEFRQLNPPHVINDPTSASTGGGIAAVLPSPTGVGTQTIDIYKVEVGPNAGKGTAGLNVAPNSLEIAFDSLLDPSTINNQTILLQAAGGDGIFGNANSPQDKFIDLSGKLFYDTNTRKLVIKLADANLKLASDLYRVTILGNGANVVRDKLGNALDGENLDGSGAQEDLPSGDGFPGGNFVFSFSIDSTPPVITANTLILAPSSDSGNRDLITNINTPTFTGTFTDVSPRGNLAGGNTVILDYAGADGRFGRLIPGATPGTFVVDPTDPFGKDDVLNIGTALSVAAGTVLAPTGTFSVTVGQDAAKTGLVPAGYTLPDSNYNVGPDGILGTADDSGKSIVRVRIVDQSGNQSSTNDGNAHSGLIVDTQKPFVVGQDPAPFSQVSAVNGVVSVTIGINENLDPSTLNASTIKVLRAGGDGVFGNANDQTLSIGTSITVTPLFINGTATPSGVVLVRFTIIGATVNDLYRVILVGSGSNPIRDVAQNPLSMNYTDDFVVFNSSAINHLFVGATATNPNALPGTRANPYPTIQAGIDAAGVGDVVQVLPGVYNENVALKSFVRVLSADPSSTDAVFVPGQALQTIIRPVPVTDPVAGTTTYNPVAVTGSGLSSLANIPTELAGFTLTNGLTGDPNRGTITSGSAGLVLQNSDILVDRNYFTDSEKGAIVIVSGANAPAAVFQDNGFIGNNVGLLINDGGTASFRNGASLEIVNNTLAFNTFGIYVMSTGPLTGFVDVANNIFASNNTLTTPLGGAALISTTPGRAVLRSNMFYNNGSSSSSGVDDVIGAGGSFDPHLLTTTPDILGNFIGNAGFVNARDPRPIADGPANFFLDANFDLTLSSAAIDNALSSIAPKLDFLNRGRVDIANKGFTGRGPADIGAFEFNGTGGITTGTTPTGTTTTPGGGFRPQSASFDEGTSTPADSAASTPAISASAADAVFSDTGSTTTPTAPAVAPAVAPTTPAPVASKPTVVVNTVPAPVSVPILSARQARLNAIKLKVAQHQAAVKLKAAQHQEAMKLKIAQRHPLPSPAYLGSRFRKG